MTTCRRPGARVLLAVVPAMLAASTAGAQRRPLFDAMREYHPAAVRPVDLALVRRDVLPAARRMWGRVEGCREEFRALGSAYGAFTERGMAQHAVLYRFCETGHDLARGGVAIVQAGRVVAHVVIEDAEPDGLLRLPDIDRDGVSEMMLVDFALHQGESTTGVSILQLERGAVRSLGGIDVHRDNFGTRGSPRSERSSVLWVTPGARPVFERETYEFREGMRARWVGSERLHVVTLTPRGAYRRVR
jgi:hypothetical protein